MNWRAFNEQEYMLMINDKNMHVVVFPTKTNFNCLSKFERIYGWNFFIRCKVLYPKNVYVSYRRKRKLCAVSVEFIAEQENRNVLSAI